MLYGLLRISIHLDGAELESLLTSVGTAPVTKWG